jgi:hypothetical protein
MDGRFLNVSLLPGSRAHVAYYARAGPGDPPALDLRFFGGKTIPDLVFANHYLGGPGAWVYADTASIDAGLAKAMSDNALQSVLQQYYEPVHVAPDGTAYGAGPAVYYAVGVYSEEGNGIPVFDQPWKNVTATFYHELNEARTDPDVEDAIRTGDSSRLGWYSAQDGEIGDVPVRETGTSLALVFTEIELADGSGAVPVQLMWSNKDDGPACRIG